MPKLRKYFPHNSVVFITTRVQEGIPLPPSYVINAILWGILSEARSKYQVRICHFAFMGNHLHLLLMVDNPEHVSEFMRYVKAETSHAINRLLGRDKRTIWEEGYDSPLVPTLSKILHHIKYIYVNPSRASLVDSIKEYPGVSSWEMFVRGIRTVKHAKIPRPELRPLYSPALSINEQRAITRHWEDKGFKKSEFTLEPWAWVELFPGVDIEQCRSEILESVFEDEEYYRQKRLRENKRVVGATALRRQSMLKEHTPEKRGRRMVVICEDLDLRKSIVEHFRSLCAVAVAAYSRWKQGDLRPKIPPGMFAPRLPVLASALPI